jgi:hypothetical protein
LPNPCRVPSLSFLPTSMACSTRTAQVCCTLQPIMRSATFQAPPCIRVGRRSLRWLLLRRRGDTVNTPSALSAPSKVRTPYLHRSANAQSVKLRDWSRLPPPPEGGCRSRSLHSRLHGLVPNVQAASTVRRPPPLPSIEPGSVGRRLQLPPLPRPRRAASTLLAKTRTLTRSAVPAIHVSLPKAASASAGPASPVVVSTPAHRCGFGPKAASTSRRECFGPSPLATNAARRPSTRRQSFTSLRSVACSLFGGDRRLSRIHRPKTASSTSRPGPPCGPRHSANPALPHPKVASSLSSPPPEGGFKPELSPTRRWLQA